MFLFFGASSQAASLYLTGQVTEKLKFLWKSGQIYLETNSKTPLKIFVYKSNSLDVASSTAHSYIVTACELFNEKDLKDVEKIVIEAP
jgi:hypothetical protein